MTFDVLASAAVLDRTGRMSERERWRLVWVVAALLGLLLALIGYIATSRLTADLELFRREGVAATGTVIDKRWGFRSNNRTYNLTIAYQVADAGRFERTLEVNQLVYDRLAKGASVELEYAGSEPSRIALPGTERHADIVAFTWFQRVGVGLLAISVFGFLASGGGGRSRPAPPGEPSRLSGQGSRPRSPVPTARGFGKR